MIISKSLGKLEGLVEYTYGYNRTFHSISEDELDDTTWDSERFNSLSELLELLSPEKVKEIQDNYDADYCLVSNITFTASSNDESETLARVMVGVNGFQGHLSTKINNDDIESRMKLNLEKVKRIIDNTLDEYPVMY